MKKPPIPANEAARLDALRSYDVLDTPPEQEFDALAAIAAHIVGVPIALVSLVDVGRQWFKSRHGLDAQETPREISFCGHVVADDAPLIVRDAHDDDRFRDNPLVTGDPRVRFYAGMPLRTRDGYVLGTLCAIDYEAREISSQQREMLRLLAKQVVDQLELRRANRDLRQKRATLELLAQDHAEVSSQLRSIIDSANRAIIETAPDGTIRLFNATAERLFGYSAEEMIGRNTPACLLDPDELAARARALRADSGMDVESGFATVLALLKPTDVHEDEWTGVRRRGEHFPVHLSLTTRRDAAGKVIGHMAVVNDITERKRARLELIDRERSARLNADMGNAFTMNEALPLMLQACTESMVQNCGAALARIWTLNAAENILELQASAGLYTHIGGAHGRVPVGKFKIGLIAEERKPHLTNAVIGDPRVGDQEWAAREGMVSFAGYPLLLEDRVVGVMAMFATHPLSDATLDALGGSAKSVAVGIARKRNEAELNQFRATLDRTQDAICIFRPDTLRFLYANRGAVNQLGYSEAELLQMTPLDIEQAVRPLEYRELLAALVAGTKSVVTFDTIQRHRNGHEVPVEVVIQYMARQGEEPRFTSIARDISERKRIDKLQSEFVSTVSHELRTPLTSIRGALGLVAGGVLGELPKEAQEYVGIALSNSDRLVRLINDILDIEKMQSGRMEFRMRTVDLRAAVGRALAANESFAAQYKVGLRILAEPAPGDVLVDEDRLTQVIANLVSNAAKFSPSGSDVEVSVTRIEDRLRVSVRDNGPGIPEAFRQRIFDRFAQADASTTRQKGGTGLGLNIAKAIVDRMRGRIGFESGATGGTTFFFELPFLSPVDQYEGGASHDLVLVCEDDPDMSRLIARTLVSAGFVVHAAPTLERARELLSRHSYRLMTLDLGLADGDGGSLIPEVRASPAHRALPVIVISGSKGRFDAAALAVADIIQKPFDDVRLRDALQLALRGARHGAVSVLHVEDDPDVRLIVGRLLPKSWKVAVAGSVACAREQLRASPFDIVLLDLSLPDGTGADLLADVGDASVVIFSAEEVASSLSTRVALALTKTKATEEELRDRLVGLVAKLGTIPP